MNHTTKIVIAIVLILSAVSFGGTYSGGSGTAEDPYLISTAEDMNQIGRNYTDWGKCFKLTADINLCAYTGTQFSRIGTDARHAFSGVFDGNEHTISGFTYTAEGGDYIGVFGNVSAEGRVENVSLVDINVTGRNYVGGLVGYNEGSINNCYSTGSVSGSQYVGGLVGYNNSYDSSISDCYSTGSVAGGDNSYCLGGLVGANYGGYISNCYSIGVVTSGYNSGYLGGLAGFNSEGDIYNCDSTGSVTGGDKSYALGGLVGSNSAGSRVNNCYSTGAVTGGDESCALGGLVGDNTLATFNPTISNSYSKGNVTGGYGARCLGGLVGNN